MYCTDYVVNGAAVVALIGWLGYTAIRHRRAVVARRDEHPLPPGPKGLPLVGNVLDVPPTHEWLKAAEWRGKYGDLVYLELFGRRLIFVNSYETAVDLLEKRSANYSSRPVFTMVNELQKWDWLLALMPYGEYWRKHRNVLHSFLEPPNVTKYMDIQTKTTMKMLDGFVRSPENFVRHVRTAVGAMILMISYGHEVKDENDRLISLVEDAVGIFAVSTPPGSFLVNVLPMLKHVPAWVPGAGFQNFAKTGKDYSMAMLHNPYEVAKKEVLAGTARPSMASELIERNMDENGNIKDEDYIARATASVYGGGSDTTVSAILAFIMAMVLYPEVQRRGQEELDQVLGGDRLPSFEDRDKLPYIEAICLEALRWATVAPMGGPRETVADDVYNGYFIPKGTMILPNQWLMSNDPAVHPNPEVFRPERHIASEGKPAERSPLRIAFGFGRRYCPGRHLSQQEIFITVANILAMFDISHALGPYGKPIDVEFKLKPGLIRQPEPFQCSITPRAEKKVELLRQILDALDS